jgi:putative oxidoreductase
LLELLGLYFGAAVAILAVGPGLFAIDELIVRRFSPELEREQSGSIDTVLSDGGVA